ncbi:MAG: hypothetical protein ACP6IP_01485 [Candidatus Njordarchaeia archaeon]
MDSSTNIISWSQDSNLLAIGAGYLDASIRIFDAKNGKLLHDTGSYYKNKLTEEDLEFLDNEILDEGEKIINLEWSPNNEIIAKVNMFTQKIHLYKLRKTKTNNKTNKT